MNLLHLQYFYVVSKEGSFSRASHSLRINQPALSRMVKQLEENLRMQLLERQPRGVKLTTQGAQIFQLASEIFEKVDELKKHTGELQQVCQGELRIGSPDGVAKSFLVPAIDELTTQWPKLYPIVQTGSATDLISNIASGRLEFGLFFHTPSLPLSAAITKRWPVRFHLVCSKEQKKNKQVLARFIGSREVDDDFNRKFPTLEKWKKKIPSAEISISSNSLLFHVELVRAGAGISILPSPLVERDLVAGALVDLLPNERSIFDLKLVQRKNVELSFSGKSLINLIDKAALS